MQNERRIKLELLAAARLMLSKLSADQPPPRPVLVQMLQNSLPTAPPNAAELLLSKYEEASRSLSNGGGNSIGKYPFLIKLTVVSLGFAFVGLDFACVLNQNLRRDSKERAAVLNRKNKRSIFSRFSATHIQPPTFEIRLKKTSFQKSK